MTMHVGRSRPGPALVPRWGFVAWLAVLIGQPVAAQGPPAAAPPKPLPPPARVQVIQPGNGRLQLFAQLPQNVRMQPSDRAPSVFYPPDRTILQRLARSRELLDERRYAEAVQLLGTILEGPEDYFFRPDPERPVYRSLKTEAQRLLGGMPAEGLAAYRLQFGAKARQLLDAAVADGDEAGLAEVSRRFFHTEAGYEATFLLGALHQEQGEPLAAALCYRRLIDLPDAAADREPDLSFRTAVCWAQAGMFDHAATTLVELRQRSPRATVRVAARELPLFADDAQAASWLRQLVGGPLAAVAASDEVPLYRGNAARNLSAPTSSPLLNRRWAVPSTTDPYLEQFIARQQQVFSDQGVLNMATTHPIAAGPYVFLRSVMGLVAVDFATGKRVWAGHLDDGVQELIEPGGRVPAPHEMAQVETWVRNRLWDNATYGTLSTDGRLVYAVEEAGPALAGGQQTIVLANGRLLSNDLGSVQGNRLVAYEIASEGKLRWELGGPDGVDPQLAEAAFLGPPLPLGGRLYVLVEARGEIRLLALEPESGRVDWSQQLVALEADPLGLTNRRAAGLSPSFSDGVLVCPTSAGAAVAVDLTTRALLWGFEYPRTHESLPRGVIAIQWGVATGSPSDQDRWIDTTAALAEGRVILTPYESNQIYCLNMLDGSLIWEKPRDDGLYVACVGRGQVLIVGRNRLRSLKLSDGSSVWRGGPIELPAGTLPSGRGYFDGQRYYLPLTSAEVAVVDLELGQIVARAKSRTGIVPGNLVCHRGSVLSQTAAGLECYFQVDQLREEIEARLATRPEDPQALALKGELLLDGGRAAEAVSALRQAFALQPAPRTRNLLVDALLEGLRTDFAAHRDDTPEIERLLESPEQRLSYFRVAAEGLQAAGDVAGAFAMYLKVLDLGVDPSALERVDPLLSVRRDRWLRARFEELWARATEEQRAPMAREIEARLARAREVDGPDGLRSFLAVFGAFELSSPARWELAERLSAADAWLEAELTLRELAERGDGAPARRAVASLLRLMNRAGRASETAAYVERLTGPWAELECEPGRTGRQLVDELLGPERQAALASTDPWPTGRVDRSDQRNQAVQPFRTIPIEIRGLAAEDPGFGLDLDQQQQALVARDRFGVERWRLPLLEGSSRGQYAFNPSLSHARLAGHLLFLSAGFEVVAIDMLGGPGEAPARVLWRRDVTEPLPNMPRHAGIHGRVINLPWGVPRFEALDTYGRPCGGTGPVVGGLVLYQRHRNLIAADPLTGEPLWTRHDVAPGSDLFGDEEYLFVHPPDAAEAVVLRTIDGREVGRRAVPSLDTRMLSLGRRVLVWRLAGGDRELALLDPWTQKIEWSREYPDGAMPWPLEQSSVGVLNREGKFELVDAATGRVETAAELDIDPATTDIYMFRSATRDLLVTTRQRGPGVNIQPVPGGYGNPLVNGAVFGFDRRTGKLAFRTRIENRGLTLLQPRDAPVLVFASQIFQQAGDLQSRTQQAEIVALDKRTGRIVLEERMPGGISTVEVIGEPDKAAVVLKTQRGSIRLQFTDEPVPPAKEPEAKAPAPPAPNGGDAPAAAAPPAANVPPGLQIQIQVQPLGPGAGVVPIPVPAIPAPPVPAGKPQPAAPPEPEPRKMGAADSIQPGEVASDAGAAPRPAIGARDVRRAVLRAVTHWADRRRAVAAWSASLAGGPP